MITRDKRTDYYEKQLYILTQDLTVAKQIGDPDLAGNVSAEAASLLNDTEHLFGSDQSFYESFRKQASDLIVEADAFVADMEYDRY